MKRAEEPVPTDRDTKKPYVRPTITSVALRPEEAVLGACKSGTSAGPGSGRCSVPGCSTVGS